MKLTKEQKEMLAQQLSTPWGRVELLCDGYRVNLVVERCKGMTYRVVTYINGCWKGEWMSGTQSHPEQKFLRKSERSLCSAKERADAEKLLGKRYVAKQPFYNEKITIYDVSWASGKAAINHLCKVCESVEVAPPAAGEAA